ncbi:hypothetical protein JCM10450v2_008128 [Rhodotorula kratochvilovae]
MSALSASQQSRLVAAQASTAAPAQGGGGEGGLPASAGGGPGEGGERWWTAERLQETRRRAHTTDGICGGAGATGSTEGRGAGGAAFEHRVVFGSFPPSAPFVFTGFSPTAVNAPQSSRSPPTRLQTDSVPSVYPSGALPSPPPAAAPSFTPFAASASHPAPFLNATAPALGFYCNGDQYASDDVPLIPMSPPLASFFAPPPLKHEVILSWAGSNADAATVRIDGANDERLSKEEKERIRDAASAGRRASRAVPIKKPPPPPPSATPPTCEPAETYPSPISPSAPLLTIPKPPDAPFVFSPTVTTFHPRPPAAVQAYTPPSPSPAPRASTDPSTPLRSPVAQSSTLNPAAATFPSRVNPLPLSLSRSPSPLRAHMPPSRPASACTTSAARAAIDADGSESGSSSSTCEESAPPNPQRNEREGTPSPSLRDVSEEPCAPSLRDEGDEEETPSPSPRASGTRTPPNSPTTLRSGAVEEEGVVEECEEAVRGPKGEEVVDGEREAGTKGEASAEKALAELLGEAEPEVERGVASEGEVEEEVRTPRRVNDDAAEGGKGEKKDEGEAQAEERTASTPEDPPPAKKARTCEIVVEADEEEGCPRLEKRQRSVGLKYEPTRDDQYTSSLHANFGTPASQPPPVRSDTLVRAPARIPPPRMVSSPWPTFFPDARFTAVANGSNPFATPPFPLQTQPSPTFNPTARPFFPTPATSSAPALPPIVSAKALPPPTAALPSDPVFATVRALLDAAQGKNGVYERKLHKFAAVHEADRKRIEVLEALHDADSERARALEADVARLRADVRAGEIALAQVRRMLDERGRGREQLVQLRKDLAAAQQCVSGAASAALERETARAERLAREARELRERSARAEKARDKPVEHLQALETARVVALRGLEEQLRASRDEAREWRSKAEQERVEKVRVADELENAVKARDELDRGVEKVNKSKQDLDNKLAAAILKLEMVESAADKLKEEGAALATLSERKLTDCERQRDSAATQRDDAIRLLVFEQDRVEQLTRSLDDAYAGVRDLIELSDELEKTCRAQVEAMRAALVDETKRADEAKAARAHLVSQSVAKLKDLQAENDRLRAAHGVTASNELKVVQVQLKDVQAQHATTARRLEEADRARDALREKYDDAAKALEGEKRARAGVEALLKNKNKTRDEEIKSIQAQLDALKGSSQKIRQLEQVAVGHQRQMQKVEQERDSALGEVDEAGKHLDATFAEMEALRQEKSAVEQELQELKSKRGTAALGGRTFVSRVGRGTTAPA